MDPCLPLVSGRSGFLLSYLFMPLAGAIDDVHFPMSDRSVAFFGLFPLILGFTLFPFQPVHFISQTLNLDLSCLASLQIIFPPGSNCLINSRAFLSCMAFRFRSRLSNMIIKLKNKQEVTLEWILTTDRTI